LSLNPDIVNSSLQEDLYKAVNESSVKGVKGI
jgi:hypothetical protein